MQSVMRRSLPILKRQVSQNSHLPVPTRRTLTESPGLLLHKGFGETGLLFATFVGILAISCNLSSGPLSTDKFDHLKRGEYAYPGSTF
mmetsp:Transcript_37477/g.67792  ORF Transcript_37477/g.67792 Transcript_37477/m.67792 type:complete len:88 (-) Transcript_37477:370-633(-)